MTATATLAHVTVARSELARAVRAANTIKAKAIHLNLDHGATVTACTSECGVRITLDADASEMAGAIYVPRVQFTKILPYCGPELRLAVDGGALQIDTGAAQFVIPPAPTDASGAYDHDFELPRRCKPVSIDAPVLVEALRRALPFASRDYTRPILATVALYPHDYVIVATDSYRLAVVRYGDEGHAGEPILIGVTGADSVRRLLAKKLGTVTIAQRATGAERRVHVRFEDLHWSIRAPEIRPESAGYPNWQKLLPTDKPATTIKVDRDELLAASRPAAFVAGPYAPLRLVIDADGVKVTATGRGSGARFERQLLSADAAGEHSELGLNPNFVADIAAAAPVERLTLTCTEPLRPLLVSAARDRYLLMPIRLNV